MEFLVEHESRDRVQMPHRLMVWLAWIHETTADEGNLQKTMGRIVEVTVGTCFADQARFVPHQTMRTLGGHHAVESYHVARGV